MGFARRLRRYLRRRFYGGWVAPNIFYLGTAGVVNFGGLRIAGLTGIYKDGDFYKGAGPVLRCLVLWL